MKMQDCYLWYACFDSNWAYSYYDLCVLRAVGNSKGDHSVSVVLSLTLINVSLLIYTLLWACAGEFAGLPVQL